MSNRSWFFASNGQQQGPFPEAQFRDMIARGQVTPQTLVWSEGMAGWQRAGEVPGLASGGIAPPAMPPGGGPVTSAGGYGAPAGYGGVSTMSIDFGIWDFTWRTILFLLGSIFIIPIPWLISWYVKWFTTCVQAPGRPNLSWTGKSGTIALWFFGAFVILILFGVLASIADNRAISNLGGIVQLVMYWLFLRYLVANVASNGQPLGLSFSGSFWAYFGWNLLLAISIITIIGWAWVYTAQVRWIYRNIQGTRRQVLFQGTGLQFLWRAIVAALACFLIIPIPWIYRWMMGWQLSQTELVERGAHAA